jgi:diguanylate cyclase (GGDEF)-like protein
MRYTGRLAATGVMLTGIIIMRAHAYIYFGYPLTEIPLVGIIFVGLAYAAGLQYDKVCFFSEKDSLTRCYNRRYVSRNIPLLLARVEKKQERLSLALLDCDNFKAINDVYGHQMGDRILKEVAALILANIRKSDSLVRWGGDEFILITPYIGHSELQTILSRINQALGELSKKLQVEIRVSSGIASYPQDAQTFENLIKVADHAMYESKPRKTARSQQYAG